MSEIHRDRELEHLESMLYSYKVENKSMDTENERLKQEIRRLLANNTNLRSAVEEIYKSSHQVHIIEISRAALGGDND
jgi:hypothetical protein